MEVHALHCTAKEETIDIFIYHYIQIITTEDAAAAAAAAAAPATKTDGGKYVKPQG
jgi:hypothetical protein